MVIVSKIKRARRGGGTSRCDTRVSILGNSANGLGSHAGSIQPGGTRRFGGEKLQI